MSALYPDTHPGMEAMQIQIIRRMPSTSGFFSGIKLILKQRMHINIFFSRTETLRRLILTGFVMLVFIYVSGCTSAATSVAGNEQTDGRVIYVALEGGFYGIETETAGKLFPLNLDTAYRRDGLKIRFTYRIVKNTGTTVMWGTPVEIIQIEKK